MYDLFGDLPSAKNTLKGKTDGDEAIDTVDDKAISGSSTTIKSNEEQSTVTSTSGEKKSISLVGALGNAGKTNFFVPVAVTRKPAVKPKRGPNSSGGIISSSKKRVRDITEDLIGNDNKQTMKDSDDINNVKSNEPSSDTKIGLESKQDGIKQQQNQNELINIHDAGESSVIHPSSKAKDVKDASISEYKESQELERLHASVTPDQMYDPQLPNDYLSYRKRKEQDLLRADLERQAKKTLEMQDKLRSQIEEERKKAEATGDAAKIIESRLGQDSIAGIGRGRGRGRGRGAASNLPAWLIEKQRNQQQGTKESASETTSTNGQFDDATNDSQSSVERNTNRNPGFTIILTNIVEPGCVDDDLATEVQEECEKACGKVENIEIKDADTTSKEVRVFVTFQSQDHAKAAATMFNGRIFGNRKIGARLQT